MGSFSDKYPAFIVGVCVYLGVLISLGQFLATPFLILILILTALDRAKFALITLVFTSLLMGYTFTQIRVPTEEYAEGLVKAYFTDKNDLGRVSQYKGTLVEFSRDGKILAKNIPATAIIKKGYTLPLQKEIIQEGSFTKVLNTRVSLNIRGDKGLQPKTLREKLKLNLKGRIEKSVQDERASAFLTGLATGSYSHKELTKELKRFALQHIMAISGFHFALIALFVTYLLKFIVSESIARPAVMCILTGYFTFLGWSPSIFRAWVMAIVFLSSSLFYRKSKALNALGVAAFFGLSLDPLSALSLGFQFSFGITTSILFFFAPIEQTLRRGLPMRRWDEISEWNLADKTFYALLYWIRNTVALTLSVTLVSMPLSLHLFHTFPLQSLLMNFIFPLGTSVVMLFLLPGLLIKPLLLFSGFIATHLLNLAYSYPLSLEYWVILENSNSFLITIYFFLLFFAGVLLTNNDRKGILLSSFKRRS